MQGGAGKFIAGLPLVRALRIPLVSTSLTLIANAVTASLLGFTFWALAARLLPPSAVGLGSALVSAAALCSFLATLGLDHALLRFLPERRGREGELILAVALLALLIGLAVGGVFLLGIPWWARALTEVRADLWSVVAFLLLAGATTTQTVLNAAFISFRQSILVLAQSATTGLLRILLVAGGTALGAGAIVGAWGFATAAVAVVSFFVALPRLTPVFRSLSLPPLKETRHLLGYSFLNHLTLLFWNTPSYLLPLLVVDRLGAEANAYFYSAYAIVGGLWAVPLVTAVALLAQGAGDRDNLGLHLRRSLVFTFATVVPAIVVLWLGGGWLLHIFGPTYAAEGTGALRVLSLVTLPLAVNSLYVGVKRVDKELTGPIILTGFISLSAVVATAFLLPYASVSAPGYALLAAHTTAALWVVLRWAAGRDGLRRAIGAPRAGVQEQPTRPYP